MSYRYDRKKKIQNVWYFVGTLVLIIVFFTPLPRLLFDLFERPLQSAWQQSQENGEELSGFLNLFYSKAKLQEKQDELEGELNQLRIDALRTQFLESTLESYQKFSDDIPQARVAQVLVRAPQTPSGTLIIDMGSQDGILLGSEVVTHDNLSLGTVSEVYDTTSVVTLYTGADQETQAVLYPHGETFMLLGHGDGYKAELSRDVEVEEGDVAYRQLVPGRILGVVQKVLFDPRDPFKQVYFSLPVDANSIQTVGIIPQTDIARSITIEQAAQ